MLSWPALCGLTHLIVSKNPLLIPLRKIKNVLYIATLSGNWRDVNKDKSYIRRVNVLLINGQKVLDFSNSRRINRVGLFFA